MILYHFTNVTNLAAIMRQGALLLTESHVSNKRRMSGPPVLWLTKNPDRFGPNGVEKPEQVLKQLSDWWKLDKTRIRITVELPKVRVTRYTDWARSQGIDRNQLASIMANGGAHSWFVSTHPVPMDAWTKVEDLEENKPIWIPGPRPAMRGAASL